MRWSLHALIALALVGGVARAEMPTVAVRDFKGPQGKKMRTGVILALKKQVKVVKNPKMADNVIEGVVAKKSKKWKLTVTVRVAATGSWIDDVVVQMSKPAVSGAARKLIAKKVMALIRKNAEESDEVALARGKRKKGSRTKDNDATGAAGAFADEEDGQAAAPEAAEPAAARTAAAPIDRSGGGAPIPATDGEASKPKEKQVALAAPASQQNDTAVAKPPTEPEIHEQQPQVRMMGGEVLSLTAGASFQQRNFQAVGFGRLPIYTSDMYPSVYAGGTLYPLGFTKSFVRGFGLWGTFERALGLKSRVQASGEVFDTVAQRIEGGALWRIHLFGPTGPTFRPMALYGQQKFDIGGMTDMPDTDYEYYGGGMDLDLPLFTPQLALVGSFQYDQIQSLGATAGFGQTATAWGYAWEAGVRADLPWRLRGLAVFTNIKRNATYTGLSNAGPTASQAHDEWTGGRVALALDF